MPQNVNTPINQPQFETFPNRPLNFKLFLFKLQKTLELISILDFTVRNTQPRQRLVQKLK